MARQLIASPPASRRRLKQMGETISQRLESFEPVQKLDAPGLQLYALPNFLTAEECAMLCEKIDGSAMPSSLFDQDYDTGFRTSYSGNLDRSDPDVYAIDYRICQLMGLDPRHGESLQGQRYAVGQQFKPHFDFFFTDQAYWKNVKGHGGQRCWTAMIYLNEVEEGGMTEFTHIGMGVPPQRGVLLVWNNMDADGNPNQAAKHAGRPVARGMKYIVTKWFREGYWS